MTLLRLIVLIALASLLPASAFCQSQEFGYHRLEGTIAGKEVVVNLTDYQASYYYKNVGEPIYLQVLQKDTTNGDTLNINEWTRASDREPSWRIVMRDGRATGIWTSGDSTRHFPIDLHEAYPAGSYPFEVFSNYDSVVRQIGKVRASASSITEVIVPSASIPQPQQSYLASEIANAVNCSGHGADLRDCIAKLERSYLDSNIAEFDDTSDVDDSDFAMREQAMQWYSTQYISPRYNDHNVLVLDQYIESYTGGAHPNHGTNLICIDVAGHRALKLHDITTASKATLRSLLEQYFRKQYGLQKGQDLTEILFENKLDPNDNFYITDKGLGFMYAPYEVAAYAMSDIEVFIPFSALKGKLTAWTRERFLLGD